MKIGIDIISYLPAVITNRFHMSGMLTDVAEVSQATPQALAQSVGKLLGDPELRRVRSTNGRKLVRDRFTIGKVVDLPESHYNS